MTGLHSTPLASRLSTKLVAGFIAIVTIFSALGLMASRQISEVRMAADQVVRQSEAVQYLQAARVAAAAQIQANYELIVEGDAHKVDGFIEAQHRRQTAIADARSHAETDQEIAWFNSLDSNMAAFDDNFLKQIVPAWRAGDLNTVLASEKVSDGYLVSINNLAVQLAVSFGNRNLEAQNQVDRAATEANSYLLFAAAIGLGLSLVVIMAAVRGLSRPVAELKRATEAMARGEMGRRVQIDTSDEIADLGQTFNLMAAAMEKKIGQLTSLSEIALAVSSELDWERVINTVMEKGIELTNSHSAAIALYDESRGVFIDTYTKGLSPAFVSRMQFRQGGLAEEVLLGDRAVFSDDLKSSHRLSRAVRDEGIKAFVCLPLKVRQRKLGVLYVYSKTSAAYGGQELSVLSILSSQAAIAIQNAQMFERTHEEAVTDGLTGLYNQKYFYARLKEEADRSARSGKPLSVIFCDLDKFKAFNDVNGHGLGDEALKSVSRLITESKRAIDIAARYGGEEFAVILPETDSTGAQIIAHRIRRRVAGFSFEAKAAGNGTLTTSIGVASYPADAAQARDLVDKADWCMYYGKRQGGNQVVLFHEELDSFGKEPREDTIGDEMHLAAIKALAQSVDQHSTFCQRHAESVASLAADIAARLELPEDEIYRVRVAGLLHDIGFVSVPDEVVNKEEQLSPDEWEKIKSHPEVGTAILQHIASMEGFLPAIRHHHEHFDGEGYPDGLSRDGIPLGARIIAVADAYQAMVCDRPYRKALTREQAVDELQRSAGTQFDPAVVAVFVTLMKASETVK
ncbi:MAG: diguanylate cyclase [Thermoleophilia bacterium]